MVAYGPFTRATVSASARLWYHFSPSSLTSSFSAVGGVDLSSFFFFAPSPFQPETVNIRELNQLFDAGYGNILVCWISNKPLENIESLPYILLFSATTSNASIKVLHGFSCSGISLFYVLFFILFTNFDPTTVTAHDKMNKLLDELKLLFIVSNNLTNGTYYIREFQPSSEREGVKQCVWLCRIVRSLLSINIDVCVCVCTATVAVLNNSLEVASRLPSKTNIIRLLRCQFKRVFGELLPFRKSHPVPIFFGIVKYERFSIFRMHRHKQTRNTSQRLKSVVCSRVKCPIVKQNGNTKYI